MQWGPQNAPGGCYIRVDGGRRSDAFAVDSLLRPVILAVNKCFVGAVEDGNDVAATKVGPGNDWRLSVVLEARWVGGNDSAS